MVKREQEIAEQERLKDMEERRRKKLRQQRVKRFLEAAFDGENDELLVILKEVSKRLICLLLLFLAEDTDRDSKPTP